MAQIETANTFVTGDVIDAPSLNNIIDQAFAQPAIITGQTSLSGTIDSSADKILIWDASASGLRQALISALPGAGTVTNVAFDSGYPQPVAIFTGSVVTGSSTAKIRLSLDNQGPNKVLAGPASGTATTPTFRALTPADLPSATVIDIAANDIDCTLGSVFFKTLTTNTTLNISNLADGQTIKVRVDNDVAGTKTVGFNNTGSTPPIVWRGGITPVLTHAPNARDIFTFARIHSLTFGYADQAFTG